MTQTALTPAEFWNEVEMLSVEIGTAITIHHTCEEINRLAAEDMVIRELLYRDTFWQVHRSCLQASLFLTLARIFDTQRNAHTIHTLVNAALGNLQLFSAEALAFRKAHGGPETERLDSDEAPAWVPTIAEDLRHLKKALAPHAKRFEDVYRPIRNSIYAHRLMTDAEAGWRYFGRTVRDDVGATLDFLHDLVKGISNLYEKGLEPRLGERDFKKDNQEIRDGVAKVLRSLHSMATSADDSAI